VSALPAVREAGLSSPAASERRSCHAPAGVALPLAEATLDVLVTALGVPSGPEDRHRRTGLA
jgi:hypothetical protein